MTRTIYRINGRPIRSYCHWCGRPHNPNWSCGARGWERLTLKDLRYERVGFLDGEHGPRRMKARAKLRAAREALELALRIFRTQGQ